MTYYIQRTTHLRQSAVSSLVQSSLVLGSMSLLAYSVESEQTTHSDILDTS